MNILITGASRGLGFELTLEAAARGHRIWAGARGGAMENSPLAGLALRYPDLLSLLPLDVADEQSIADASASLEQQAGHLDVIVNNAAILTGRDETLDNLSLEGLEQSFRVNLFGPMLVMKHFLPLLRRGREQTVINISSEAGSMSGAYAGDYSYALSKSALNMFTAQLRAGLSSSGCSVYALHPGWIRTDMGGASAPGDAAEAAQGIMDVAERIVVPQEGVWFIDHAGRPMKL